LSDTSKGTPGEAAPGAKRGEEEEETEGVGSLASFLIARSCNNARHTFLESSLYTDLTQ
jgi:hypothetical protein